MSFIINKTYYRRLIYKTESLLIPGGATVSASVSDSGLGAYTVHLACRVQRLVCLEHLNLSLSLSLSDTD